MSKEAMKLALEALEEPHPGVRTNFTDALKYRKKIKQAITALREALAKPDFWEGYVPEPDSTCNNTLRAQGKAYPRTCKKCGLGPCVGLAQQTLDKKAENARELGLDYEPIWGGGPTNKDYEDAMRQKRLNQLTSPPAQQEPVAWMHTDGLGGIQAFTNEPPPSLKAKCRPLIFGDTSPPAQPQQDKE